MVVLVALDPGPVLASVDKTTLGHRPFAHQHMLRFCKHDAHFLPTQRESTYLWCAYHRREGHPSLTGYQLDGAIPQINAQIHGLIPLLDSSL